MTVSTRVLAPIVALATVASCLGRDQSLVNSYLNRPASGRIDGREFEIRYAYVDPTVETPDEDDYAFVLLDYRPKKHCPRADEIASDALSVTVSAPNKKTKRSVKLKSGTARSMAMQWMQDGRPQSVIASKGYFRVVGSGKGKVKAKLRGRRDTDNWVNGHFVAKICDLRDMQDFSQEVFD